MPQLLVLFESASGYALLEVVEGGDAASLKADVQAAVTELSRFSKMVKLKAFKVRICLA
jgi:nucleolar protein 56